MSACENGGHCGMCAGGGAQAGVLTAQTMCLWHEFKWHAFWVCMLNNHVHVHCDINYNGVPQLVAP